MLDWLIVGGGLHGSHLALVLRQRLGVAASDLRAVDDAPAPFAVWRQRVAACGMAYLRSPQTHHLGLRSDALRTLAARCGVDQPFTPPYKRPATALFDAHCAEVAEAAAPVREYDHVEHIEACAGGYRVHGRHDVWRARRVVLATGPAAPQRPDWAQDVPHVFDPGFSRQALPRGGSVAVVGGGLTAAQLALSLVDAGRQAHVIGPHAPRHADFDSTPCYAGPRCLAPFLRADWHGRRRLIAQARNPGTLPGDVAAGIAQARGEGCVVWHEGRAVSADDNGVGLADGRRIAADAVVLATGFADQRPGGALVDRLIEDFELPLAPCGYPAPDADLQWRPGLFVTGGLAELELGPMAGNIRGARLAGERLAG